MTRSFLVGPVHDLEGRVGVIAARLQRTHDLQRAEHAQDAVELAAGRLRIEMRAHADRRQVVALAGAPREHVAAIIDRDGAADRFASALEPVAHLTILVRKREPADAAFLRRAEPGRLHQAVPKTRRIDGEVGEVCLAVPGHGTTDIVRGTGLGAENSFQVLLATWTAGKGGRAMNCPSPFSARSSPSRQAIRPRESVRRGTPVQVMPSNTL